MSVTSPPKKIIIMLLSLFCLMMISTAASAQDVEWKNKKLEFVDHDGKKCLRAEGSYLNTSGGRVLTAISRISFAWQETRNGQTQDGSASFEDPPFHDQLAPGEKSRNSSFRICRFGASGGSHIKVSGFKSSKISYRYRPY